MVSSMTAKHLASQYSVGCNVPVRRFSSKSKKKCGKGLERTQSRIVPGEIIDTKSCNSEYKVHYLFNGWHRVGWYHVSDITSVTAEEEKKRHDKGKVLYWCQPEWIRLLYLKMSNMWKFMKWSVELHTVSLWSLCVRCTFLAVSHWWIKINDNILYLNSNCIPHDNFW